MRFILSLATLLMTSVSFAANDRLVCQTGARSAPHDTYIVKLHGKDASISVVRHAFYGSEEFAVEKVVQGCYPARYFTLTSKALYVECDGDGDAGHLKLNFRNGKITGTMNFPEGNSDAGYDQDTVLRVTCMRQSP